MVYLKGKICYWSLKRFKQYIIREENRGIKKEKKESVRKFRQKTWYRHNESMAKNVTHGIKDTWLIENQSYAGDDLIISWECI